jgi:hypothetical protein
MRAHVFFASLAVAVATSVCALAPCALAQPMLDPRQMSGVPRPDAQVPIATATVRVIHGDLAKNAEEGQLVHLVIIKSDGTVEKITRPLDKAGRATFDKLVTDGSSVYYAFTLLGDDRLESQLVSLDKMAGIRMMLAGRKLDASGAPIGDPIDDAAQPDQPVKVPENEVWVMVGGQIGEGAEIELVRVPDVGQKVQPGMTAKAQKAGDNLVARFANVPVGGDAVWLARVNIGGRWYNSKPFMTKAGAGVGRSILVVDRVVLTEHLAMELDDEQLRVQVQWQLKNFSGGPMVPGSGGIVIPLPRGAVGGGLQDESHAKLNPGKEITWKGVLPPGNNEVVGAFGLPVEDGHVRFEMPAPFGLFGSTIAVEKVPGATLRPPPGLQPNDFETDDGRVFWVMRDVTVQPGTVLRFSIDGLPSRPLRESVTRWFVGSLVLLLVIGAFAIAVWNPGKPRRPAATTDVKAAASRRKDLASRREALYAQLLELEKKKQGDDVDDARYRAQRQTLVNRLTLVLRELDQLDAGASRPS